MKEDTRRRKDRIAGIYDRIAGDYDKRVPRFTSLVLDRIDTTDDVLDIGCGTGRITVAAARRARSVTGFDLDR